MSDIIDFQLLAAQSPLILSIPAAQPLGLQLAPAIEISGSSETTFVWPQNNPLATWTVPHNLNRFPCVSVVDPAGFKIQPDVLYVDENVVQIIHATAIAGTAYLN